MARKLLWSSILLGFLGSIRARAVNVVVFRDVSLSPFLGAVGFFELASRLCFLQGLKLSLDFLVSSLGLFGLFDIKWGVSGLET